MTKTIFLATAALVTALVASASPVSAGTMKKSVNTSGDITYQTKVSYGDLNLASPEGRASLQRRLAHAEYEVCANHPTDEAQACRAFAKKSSEAQLASIVDRFSRTQVASADVR